MHSVPLDGSAYAHLLGLYRGDGCVSLLRRGVYSLRIACDQRYPGLIAEAGASLLAVKPQERTYSVSAPGRVHVQALWKHWVCLFPQHGPGRKHEIVLAGWQRQIVEEHPGRFLVHLGPGPSRHRVADVPADLRVGGAAEGGGRARPARGAEGLSSG